MLLETNLKEQKRTNLLYYDQIANTDFLRNSFFEESIITLWNSLP